jgi:amino acid adenylation domain-containing protein
VKRSSEVTVHGEGRPISEKSEDPYRYGDRIERVIAHQARRRPDAAAVQQGETTLSYGELVSLAESIAAGLWAGGVRPDDCVPIRMERGLDFVAVLLGVLRVGACYIALDSSWPAERTRHVIERSRAGFVVQDPDVDGWRRSVHRDRVPEAPGDGREPACVFYTSGSTGRPKGALSPHRGTIRALVGNPAIPLDSDTVFHQAAPLPWDGLSLELWAPLLNGGRCVLLDRDRRTLDVDAVEVAIRRGVNSMWLTSSLFNVLVEECLPVFSQLRLLLVGGERVSPSHVRRVLDSAPGLHVVNGYGPVENTIFTTNHVITRADVADGRDDVPIGRPVPRTSVVLLDEDGNEVADGVVGELATSGDGLAVGYLGDPEETARRFIVHNGRRHYRTGDLAVVDPEGNLRFRGRVDRQLKVRGVRIEPSEVEEVIERHPSVSSVHAQRVAGPDAGSTYLGCLYTSMDGKPVDAAELREFVEHHLIEPMRPTRLVHVAQLPLNPNGKVDYAVAAGMLADDRPDGSGDVSDPADSLVEDLRHLLGLPYLRADTDLVQAGTTSLDVVRLAARIGSWAGRRLTVADVYRRRTLAKLLQAAPNGSWPRYSEFALSTPAVGPRPLSHAQQRFWLAEVGNPGLADNLIVLAYELVGELDIPVLRAALADAIRANAVLRTVYPEVDDLPVSRVMPAEQMEPMVEEITVAPDGRDPQEVAEELSRDWWDTPLRLERDLPLRARICRLGDDRFLLLLQVHHIAFDGWSEGILIRRLRQSYAARLAGVHEPPAAGPDYQAYAQWERQRLNEWRTAQLPFWRDVLRAVPPPFLPEPSGAVDAPRLELVHRVGPAAVDAITASASRAGVPVAAAFTAGVARAVANSFDVDDVCLGIVTNGRTEPAVEDLIGYLVNPLPLPLFGVRRRSAADLLDAVGARMIASLENAEVPFDELVRILGARRGRHPWFQVWSVLQAPAPNGRFGENLTLRSVRVRPPRTAIELMFEAIPEPDGGWLVVQLRRADGIDQARSERMLDELGGILDGADMSASAEGRQG